MEGELKIFALSLSHITQKIQKKIMKKLLSTLALVAITIVGCAQSPKTDNAKQMTQEQMKEALAPLFENLQKISDDDPEGDAKVKEASLKFVEANKNIAGEYVICNVLGYVMDKEELIKMIDADEYFSKSEKIAKTKEAWLLQAKTGAGKMFVDFEAEYNGKTTKLSDYVGKGKYVLVDFWASWCGPCKREIPNLINVYNKYKGDKFEVLGVATWDKPDDTLKAIEQLGITYPQMLNAQKAGSDAYGIQGIPEIILFAPDGTIVARGLRGEAIEKLVKEKLGK